MIIEIVVAISSFYSKKEEKKIVYGTNP